jgi:tRNA A-37 threonylcarbamoyl transferase component Bud32
MSGLEALLTGRTLVKRYRIGEVIGRGGFAAVYRADDSRLGRQVAVKVITYPAPDAEVRDQLRDRFQREARAAASMPQHPNLVTVHDFGTDPELGLDFLVMELLDGENLANFLARSGPPAPALGVRILRDAAEGLCIGHRAGLVHRDVKPGNIFLARTGETGPVRVCLLDFGIAHLAEEGVDVTRLTKAGFTPHSPAYASPEQLRGEKHLTAASDVFSLGVVGYQLLTGEKPFAERGRRGMEGWSEPRPPRELNPEIPEAVDGILRKALAREPGDRFPDAGAMAAELDSAMGGAEPTSFAAFTLPAAVGAVGDETLLQPDPPPPPPAPTTTASTRAAAPARRADDNRRGFPAWLAAAVVVVLLGAAGLWAMTRGGGPEPAASALDASAGADTVATIEPTEGDGEPEGGRSGAVVQERSPVTPDAYGTGGEAAGAMAGPVMGAGSEPEQGPGRGNGAFPPGLAPGRVPPGQARRGTTSPDSMTATVPVAPDTASRAPAPTPATAAPPTPSTVPEPTDSVVPRPAPRLLGRPAHPTKPDTT